jgi:hypothetical protein
MDPNSIELHNLSKIFEYEKISRTIDNCDDIKFLKNLSKSFIKLYFKQQETLTAIEANIKINDG